MASKTELIKLISPLFVLLISMNCQAQNSDEKKGKTDNTTASERNTSYTSAIGLRGGIEGGITFKHFVKSNVAVEGLLSRGWGYGGFRITGLYEMQKPLPNAKGLDWFWGVGAHVGFYDGAYYGYYGYYGSGYYDKNGNWHSTGYRSHYTTIGIDGIIGLEYQFPEFPIVVGVDAKPFIDLYGRGSHYGDGAFSIRYILK